MRSLPSLIMILLGISMAGCSAIPDVVHKPRYHNPFPQLHRVAILPFFNLSEDPHVDGEAVALAYYDELQAIPGFEVLPIGVVKRQLEARKIDLNQGTDFQRLAQDLGVDVLLIGGITDFSPYYPPRMGLGVTWYAANRGFHPIPPGYGLPWGSAEEEYIPSSLVWEAEFALAREQLETQTPSPSDAISAVEQVAATEPTTNAHFPEEGSQLPPGWPDPSGFVPPPPSPHRPAYVPQHKPIIRHTRLYHGTDQEFTRRLADYYYFRDDARFGGWQSYLYRTDDFIRFCCHLHITETLAARGGVGESEVVWRWPISRYER